MQKVFEKIIDEIEKERVFYFLTIANTGDKILDVAYEKVGEVINRAIEIVKQEAEEYNNGWIPVSERLPKTNESVLCWAKSTARGGDVCFVGSCHNGFWFLQSSADTHSFPGQYVIVAWHPLPEPYQPKFVQKCANPISPEELAELHKNIRTIPIGTYQTNADRIRSMSDEELAKENIYFVSALNAKEGLHYTGLDGHYYRTAEEVVEANMKWLQSEVEE